MQHQRKSEEEWQEDSKTFLPLTILPALLLSFDRAGRRRHLSAPDRARDFPTMGIAVDVLGALPACLGSGCHRLMVGCRQFVAGAVGDDPSGDVSAFHHGGKFQAGRCCLNGVDAVFKLLALDGRRGIANQMFGRIDLRLLGALLRLPGSFSGLLDGSLFPGLLGR